MISLVELEKSFGSQKVLNRLSLEIPAGRTTAVIGPSGEGKSVLLKHMIGLMRPEAGAVLVDGEDMTQMGRSRLNAVREKFGMLFQGAGLLDSMTVFENVAFPLREKTALSRQEIEERVADALAEVGLRNVDQKYPAELSGGMKKRVGLARALLLRPEIILFDEPTTGLDPIIRNAIHQLIYDMQAKFGFTAVIVSHDIPEIFDVAHNVAMLYRGEILEAGSPDDIKQSQHPVVRQFITGSLQGPIQFLR